MADYYPLIARAVEGLTDKSPTVRRAVYERARNALVAQLQSLQPAVAPVDIDRERAALDLAIGAVEALYVLPSSQTAADMSLPAEPSQTLLEPIDRHYDRTEVATAERAEPQVAVARPEIASEAAVFDSPDAALAAVERPRIGSKTHSSGQANRVRAIILVMSVLVVVVAIASWKLYDRDQQAKLQAAAEQQASEAADNTQSETGKFTDRLGAGMVQEASGSQARGGDADTTAAVAVQKAVLFETDPTTVQLPPAQQKVIASEGLTKWRLEQKSAGQGLPLENVIHGEVDFPQAGFKVDFQMRKNTDGSAVSHLITLTFSHKEGDTAHDVVNINRVQMKDNVTDVSGNGLNVSPFPVAANVFILGLANVASQVEYNLQQLQNKNWITLDFVFPDGRLGSVAMEKGSTGFQVISDAVRAWQ